MGIKGFNWRCIIGKTKEVRRPEKSEEERQAFLQQHTVTVDIPKQQEWKPLTMNELLDAGIYY